MKIGTVLLIFFAGIKLFTVQSQELLPQDYDTTIQNHQVSLNGLAFFQTSHLRNEFSSIFLTGGFITDEIKNNSRLDEGQIGRLGGEINGELVYKSGTSLFKKKENLGWLVKLGTSNSFGFQYTPDAYELLFYGNESMLGKEAEISNTAAFNMSYLKMGFGVFNRTNKNSIAFNVLLGNSYSNLQIDRGNLAFSEDGDEIEANTDITVLRTNSHTYFQGVGASIDFQLHAVIKDVPGISGFFQISGKNLGVLYADQLQKFRLNTSTTYNGFSFNQISEMINYDSENFTQFFDSLGFSRSTTSKAMILPNGSIQAGKIVEENVAKKFQSFFGIRVLTNLVHKPMVYAGGHYSFNNWLSTGAQLTFGGYGVFRAGLYAHARLDNWRIGIGTEDIPGFFVESTFGKSILIQMKWRI